MGLGHSKKRGSRWRETELDHSQEFSSGGEAAVSHKSLKQLNGAKDGSESHAVDGEVGSGTVTKANGWFKRAIELTVASISEAEPALLCHLCMRPDQACRTLRVLVPMHAHEHARIHAGVRTQAEHTHTRTCLQSLCWGPCIRS